MASPRHALVIVALAAAGLGACSAFSPLTGELRADAGTEADGGGPGSSGDAQAGGADGTADAPANDASATEGGHPTTWTVNVGGSSGRFDPAALTIAVGDTVHWVWQSDGHTVTSGDGCTADDLFCAPNDTGCASSPALSTGQTYDHTFATAGTYPYFCRFHCGDGMKGTITVR